MEHKQATHILGRSVDDDSFERIKTILLDREVGPETPPLPLVDGDEIQPGDLTEAGIDVLACLMMTWIYNGHGLSALVDFSMRSYTETLGMMRGVSITSVER
ncbi:MAG: hypothetical protein KGL39_32170 [Patescibacteria group bacterium]|nr:hypothetical protein [Patescibacteria group bacterium]